MQLHAVSCSCMDIAKQYTYITKADPERFQGKGVAMNVYIVISYIIITANSNFI